MIIVCFITTATLLGLFSLHLQHIFAWHNLPQRLDQLAPWLGQVEPFDMHFCKGHGWFMFTSRRLQLVSKCSQKNEFENNTLIFAKYLVVWVLKSQNGKLAQLTPTSPTI